MRQPERFVAAVQRHLDVAVVDATDAVVGAIEVCHTHACDDAKLHDLTDAFGDRWCEVIAADVISAVATCAETRCCPTCMLHRLERHLRTGTHIAELRDRTALETALNEALPKHTVVLQRAQQRRNLLRANGTPPVLEFSPYRAITLGAVWEHDPAYVDAPALRFEGSNAAVSAEVLQAAPTFAANDRHCGRSISARWVLCRDGWWSATPGRGP